MMIPEAEFPQLLERRQQHLRSLASASHPQIPTLSIRQRVGRALVRFGQLVEGRCPDLTIERVPRGLSRSV
jgi:hypothetical protein